MDASKQQNDTKYTKYVLFVCIDPYCMYLHSELHLRPTFAVCLVVQNTSCMKFSHIFNITNSSSRKCPAWVPVAIPTLCKDIYIALRPLWMILHTLSHYIDLKQNAVCSCSITYVVRVCTAQRPFEVRNLVNTVFYAAEQCIPCQVRRRSVICSW